MPRNQDLYTGPFIGSSCRRVDIATIPTSSHYRGMIIIYTTYRKFCELWVWNVSPVSWSCQRPACPDLECGDEVTIVMHSALIISFKGQAGSFLCCQRRAGDLRASAAKYVQNVACANHVTSNLRSTRTRRVLRRWESSGFDLVRVQCTYRVSYAVHEYYSLYLCADLRYAVPYM